MWCTSSAKSIKPDTAIKLAFRIRHSICWLAKALCSLLQLQRGQTQDTRPQRYHAVEGVADMAQ